MQNLHLSPLFFSVTPEVIKNLNRLPFLTNLSIKEIWIEIKLFIGNQALKNQILSDVRLPAHLLHFARCCTSILKYFYVLIKQRISYLHSS